MSVKASNFDGNVGSAPEVREAWPVLSVEVFAAPLKHRHHHGMKSTPAAVGTYSLRRR
jgi:hypothetical protein